jgi:hypothetical protein
MSNFKDAMAASTSYGKEDSNIVYSLSKNKAAAGYLGILTQFCILDEAVLYTNENTVINNFIDFEKRISLEIMAYVAENAGLIASMLILNYKGFRDILADLIEIELKIDDLSLSERIYQRKAVDMPESFFKGRSMTLGSDMFDADIVTLLFDTAIKSFSKYDGTVLDNTLVNAVKTYSYDDKKVVGILLSNYMYLLRGLNHNSKFLATINMLLSDFRKVMKIK